jgi:hypothetical protein
MQLPPNRLSKLLAGADAKSAVAPRIVEDLREGGTARASADAPFDARIRGGAIAKKNSP